MNAANVTTQTGFDRIVGADLFSVNAGVDRTAAIEKAQCLTDCIRRVAETSCGNEAMDAENCYMVAFAAQAVYALLVSVNAPDLQEREAA